MAQQPAARARRLKERVQAFSARYAQARVKFLEGAAAAGLRIESQMHPLSGRDGETLAMDIALAGKPDAASLLIVSSGCHGVEGYCGSGVQVFALHDQEWRDKVSSSAVAACAAERFSTAVADRGLRCAPSRVRLRSPTTPRRPRENPLSCADASSDQGALAKRTPAISSKPSKIRLSTSSNGMDRLGAIFHPAPPVMKHFGSAPQWRRTFCTMRSIAPAMA